MASPFLLISLGFYGAQRHYELSPDEAAGLVRWVLLANAKGRYSRGSSETLLDQDLKPSATVAAIRSCSSAYAPRWAG